MASKSLSVSFKSGKIKTKEKKVVRNVLTLRPDDYWPVVPDVETSEIENILKENLSLINCTIPKVPWHILMKLTKEQRRERLEEEINSLPSTEKEKISISKQSRRHLTIGINSSIRHMEQKKLLFCLIDSSGEPQILLEKLLALSKEKQILSALVPNLKGILKNILGIPTFVLGFKDSVAEDTCPIKGCSKVKDILNKLNLSPPKNITYQPSKKDTDRIEKFKQERLSDIYLYRSCITERIFRPNSSDMKPTTDFIGVKEHTSENYGVNKRSFKRYTEEITDEESNQQKVFDSPLVLTLQNNPSKRKRKKS